MCQPECLAYNLDLMKLLTRRRKSGRKRTWKKWVIRTGHCYMSSIGGRCQGRMLIMRQTAVKDRRSSTHGTLNLSKYSIIELWKTCRHKMHDKRCVSDPDRLSFLDLPTDSDREKDLNANADPTKIVFRTWPFHHGRAHLDYRCALSVQQWISPCIRCIRPRVKRRDRSWSSHRTSLGERFWPVMRG